MLALEDSDGPGYSASRRQEAEAAESCQYCLLREVERGESKVENKDLRRRTEDGQRPLHIC